MVQAWSGWESVAVLLALLYLVLAVRRSIWCWYAAFSSTLIYLVIFYTKLLYMESALQIFYAAMAVYGWWQWRGGEAGGELPISRLTWGRHVRLVALIGVGTVGFGFLMSRTAAALPWLDSFTTVAAVIATWMVARKILENWYYWLVIDSVSIYLYLSRGLVLTAVLFGLYIILIVVGIVSWNRAYREQAAHA